jgi:starch synthase
VPARYTPSDLSGKAICKAALQERFGLDVNMKVPLFGIVSRFRFAEGLRPVASGAAVVTRRHEHAVGSPRNRRPRNRELLSGLAARYPGRVGAYIGFSNEMSHLIEAGSDFFSCRPFTSRAA